MLNQGWLDNCLVRPTVKDINDINDNFDFSLYIQNLHGLLIICIVFPRLDSQLVVWRRSQEVIHQLLCWYHQQKGRIHEVTLLQSYFFKTLFADINKKNADRTSSSFLTQAIIFFTYHFLASSPDHKQTVKSVSTMLPKVCRIIWTSQWIDGETVRHSESLLQVSAMQRQHRSKSVLEKHFRALH